MSKQQSSLEQAALIFEGARKLQGEAREAYLEGACDGNAELRAEIESMIAAHQRKGEFLASPTQPDVPFPDTRTAKDNKPAEGPGTVIGNYKLLQEIGHGGFGVVYMAEQEQPVRRKVALKIIKLGMDTKQVIARFEAERQALAMMDHPNIAKVLDAGATDTGRPYFVMELVRGVPVTEYCDTENLNTHSRLQLFMQICHAVQHAHTKGIIHRDIKPSNVMITMHDGAPVPKVIDFGIAKAIHQRLTDKTLFTEYRQLIGTPQYMSPEQAEMSGLDIDTRSDIYSLGVLLYELLTGTTPFDGRRLRSAGIEELQRIIREEEPDKPSTRLSSLQSEPRPSESDPSETRPLGSGLPESGAPALRERSPRAIKAPSSMDRLPLPHGRVSDSSSVQDIARHRRTDPHSLAKQLRGDLDWIVMKALEKDRTRRYETANSFAADVQRHLDDEPVVAGPPSAAYRMSKFVRRNRTGVITAAAVLLLLLAGIAGTSVGLIRARTAEFNQSRARQEAERARDVAAEQRQIAQAAERDQGRARQEADNARQIAEERAEELRRTVYLNNIAMADIAYNGGDIGRMNELLERCDTDLRAWEWARLKFLAGYQEPLLNPDSPLLTFGSYDAGSSVAFSPDGKWIVSGSEDQTLRVWDVFTGAKLLTLPGHEGAISSVAFSPDGERIVSGSEDKALKIWNASTGEEIMTLLGHDGQVSSVAFSPDGELIVSGSWDQTLKIWDADSGQEIMTLRGDKRTVSSTAFSPNGMRIVSGSWDKTLTLWNTKTGKEIRTFVGHEGAISSVAFSPDGKWIASGSRDATVRLWDATTGEEIRTLRGHQDYVNSVAFSPNGQRIVSGSDDEMLKLWNAYTGEEVLTLGAGEAVLAVAFGPDGRVIVSGNGEEYTDYGEPAGMSLKLWKVPEETFTSGGHDGPVSSVAFSPDGKKIVSASDDKTLKIWDAGSGEKIKTLSGHDAEVSSAVFSPDGMRIVSGSRDNTLKVWNTKTGEEIRTLVGHEGWVKTVAFSPDGRWIASGSEDKSVKVWDASTGEHILTLAGHQRSVNTVSFSPNGRQIVSGSYDEMLKLWDASTGKEILSFRGHEGWVGTVAFSPSGEKIVSGSSDKTLKVWDVSTGKEIRTLYGHIGSVSAVAFSPDGKRIVSGSFDKTLKVWDVSTGQETLTLRGHIGYVSAVAFSPDGTRIASGSADRMLRVWKTWQESG